MSKYNPDYHVEPIYNAASQWFTKSLLADQSVFKEDKKIWTTSLLDELDQNFVKNLNTDKGSFFPKLKVQLSDGSPECHQLMAESLWLILLFPHPGNIRAAKKRENVRDIWSWSGENLSEAHPLLVDAVLGGIGSAGPAYTQNYRRELVFLIGVLRDFKTRGTSDRERIVSDPWEFADWLSNRPEAQGRQLIHILPNLLFPDTFERISSNSYKRRILAGFGDGPWEETQQWSAVEIDRALLELRRRLEDKHGSDIDFYEDEFEAQWKTETSERPSKERTPIAKGATMLEGGTVAGGVSPKKTVSPLNLILYGPPGTGKTWHLKNRYLPRYQDKTGDRFEFVTFHQSYAYEDFVEGIRPVVTENGTVTYEVRPGVLKRLCDRARCAPERRFALFIDEINRGNVAKIFGELITLVERDKRIRTDTSGNRLASCTGLEVTLPYSGKLFGVPANVDVIATMNTADRSIALLDRALRRRFRFEELTPKPEFLESIDDSEGNAINLEQLLRVMNARLSRLLHRDQTLGHSYFYHVKSFDELRRVFASEILPFLQEAFYDDWRHIRYVLADQAVDEELQLVRVRTQSAAELFPKADPAEIGDGEAFEIVRENEITPDMIRKIYEPPE